MLRKKTRFRTDPRALSDREILDRLTAIRAKGLETEGLLDFMCRVSYRAYRKIFISENRDLDQTVMWTVASMVALASRDGEIKDYYRRWPSSCSTAGRWYRESTTASATPKSPA